MEKSETLQILARVCAIDRREATDLLLATWHEAIGHLEYPVAVAALSLAMKETTDNLKPGHILRNASTARVQIERRASRERRAALVAQPRTAVES